MERLKLKTPIDVIGPCSAQDGMDLERFAGQAVLLGADIVRASLWKPRTKPSLFHGLGVRGIPLLVDIARAGAIPATEVMLPEHAEQVINGIRKQLPSARIMLWLGARGQNDLIQTAIGNVIKGDQNVILGIKNQPWVSSEHWLGIVEYVLSGGADLNQLILILRGVAPPEKYVGPLRNLPSWKMATKVRQETGLPLLVDPSHIAGRADLVEQVIKEAESISPDGIMCEVHPDVETALTDKGQQLSLEQFSEIMKRVRRKESALSLI